MQIGNWHGDYHRGSAGLERSPVRESAGRVRLETKAELKVQTADGDQVSISVETLAQLREASYEGAGGSAFYSSNYSRSEIGIEVKGNLSEEELADITELIDALSGAGGEGESLDLSTLAGFDYRRTQTIEASSLFHGVSHYGI